MEIKEIRKLLMSKSDKEYKKSIAIFAPTAKKIYGVRVPVINEISRIVEINNFDSVESLWKSGAFEERLLASKVIGRICKKNPSRTMTIVRRFSKDVSDWPVCDTLATQGIRKIAKEKQDEILELSQRLVKSGNPWQRRFALVLLINYAKQEELGKRIESIMKNAEKDKEYYVKKAVVWLKSRLYE